MKGGPSGGTGKTFDWEIARNVKSLESDVRVPVIMAGGLNPSNVAEAVRRAKPWAVDVSSGVEISPGVKDHEKIKSLIQSAKSINF